MNTDSDSAFASSNVTFICYLQPAVHRITYNRKAGEKALLVRFDPVVIFPLSTSSIELSRAVVRDFLVNFLSTAAAAARATTVRAIATGLFKY